MKKLLPALPIVIGALAPVFTPDIQAYMAAHPQLAAGVGAVALLLSYLTPSPVQRNVKPSADQN